MAMTSQDHETRTRFEELSAGAQLDILVPNSADFDPTTLFHDGLPGRLSSAPSRKNLYHDEITQLNLILRTSLGERAARSLLPSLEITVSAHATDAVPQGHGNAASASGKHDLTSRNVPALEISDVLFAGGQTYMIWKPTLHITRPRVRLQRPALYFTATLNLTSTALNASRSGQSEILPSFEPLPANVLEALQFDPSLIGSGVSLPEDRITKVLPASATAREDVKPIKGSTKRAFPLVPSLYSRIRRSTVQDAVVASLHLETSHLMNGIISVQYVHLDIAEAEVRHVTRAEDWQDLTAGDEIVSLYKLTRKAETATTTASPVTVSIEASLKFDRSSSVKLKISWQAQVDLFRAGIKPSYKWSRPLSGGPQQAPSRRSIQAQRPSTSGTEQRAHKGGTGIIFNFRARSTVPKGADFNLDVHCVNRSNRTHRFALVILHPKRHHPPTHRHGSNTEDTGLVASIFNVASSEQVHTPNVLDLNPDVRIGPLPPGAIFESQMKFRALALGPLDLGTIRVVDLDTRQTVDVRELPNVIALESAGLEPFR